MPRRILLLMGTRPEAIKLAPVVAALDADAGFLPVVVNTGQHREL
ncbi:MAG: UDP-N-acetylglucosamine 2-epimerase (non-hydrolyzing), partial [Planctomycetota bacterium]